MLGLGNGDLTAGKDCFYELLRSRRRSDTTDTDTGVVAGDQHVAQDGKGGVFVPGVSRTALQCLGRAACTL